jgi:hypothetical protein
MITTLKIGSTFEKPTQYPTLTSIQDALDIGTILIPFSTRKTRYEPFTLVDVLIQGIHEYWWVDSDISEVVDKQEMLYYEHKIQLIELTKILERYPMPNRAFVQLSSGTQYTAEDIVDIIIETVPFRDTLHVVSGKVIDLVDATLRVKLAKVIVPDQYLTGRTMKEAFVEIFRLPGINGYPRLTRDINGNFILDADYYNELQSLVDKDSDNYFKQEVQNTSKYAQSLNVTGTNQIYSFSKGTSFVVEPSPTGWLNGSSDTRLVNLDDTIIETGDEIDILIKVEAEINYLVFGELETTGTFDITKRVLEVEIRSDLDEIASDPLELAQNTTIQYKQGDNEITDLLRELDETIAQTNLFNVYLATLAENGIIAQDIFGFNPADIRIRPYYSAKIDAIQEVDRVDISETNTPSTLIFGQSDSFIASDRVLDSALSRANRLGQTDTNTKATFITELVKIYPKGSYTADGFILTDVERVTYPDHFEVLYHWTKDYQKVSDFIGLNSEPKLYEVQSTLVRNELIKQYIILDTVAKTNDSYVTTLGVNVFANTFGVNGVSTFDKPIYAVAYQSPEIPGQVISNDALYRPVVSYAGGNSMAFWFGFKNFRNAGKQLITDTSGTIDKYYNKTVVYTDDDARIQDFKVKYINDFTSDPSLLPVIDSPLSADSLIDTELFRTYKNQSEILELTYQLMVLPRQTRVQDFVVGDYLTKNNNLINFKDGNFESLVIYTTDERYNISDNKFVKGNSIGQVYSADVNAPYIELDNPIGSSGIPLNWALGDANGNLYLAVNQIKYNEDFENISKIYFNFTEERY